MSRARKIWRCKAKDITVYWVINPSCRGWNTPDGLPVWLYAVDAFVAAEPDGRVVNPRGVAIGGQTGSETRKLDADLGYPRSIYSTALPDGTYRIVRDIYILTGTGSDNILLTIKALNPWSIGGKWQEMS